MSTAVIELPVRNGNFGAMALIDADDFEKVSSFAWHLRKTDVAGLYYATAHPVVNGKTQRNGSIEMHVAVLGRKSGFIIDHKNHNGLDNRKENLRWATTSQNAANRRRGRGKSKFKGVYLTNGKWRSIVRFQGKCIHLGMHDTEESAAESYNRAAIELFGEFACLNPL